MEKASRVVRVARWRITLVAACAGIATLWTSAARATITQGDFSVFGFFETREEGRWGEGGAKDGTSKPATYTTLTIAPFGTGAFATNPGRAASESGGSFDFNHWDPMPVNAFPAGQSAFGVHGTLGNGWEWTSSVFAPFPGFEPFPFYRGYSADFFDGKHFVMKGGSARTAACMLRPTFRNWFQAHYQYVYAGFRCVSH